MGKAKRIKQLEREVERLRVSLSEGSKWARSADEHIQKHCDALNGINAEQTDIVAAQDAMSTKLDRMHGDLGRIFDRLAKGESRDTEHAATVATLVEGLARLERRVSKKGRSKPEPGATDDDWHKAVCSDCLTRAQLSLAMRTYSGSFRCASCHALADCYEVNPDEWRAVGVSVRGCPCCPGAVHEGGQPWEVAQASMRRTRGERWEQTPMIRVYMTQDGTLHASGIVAPYRPTQDSIEATNWRKVSHE